MREPTSNHSIDLYFRWVFGAWVRLSVYEARGDTMESVLESRATRARVRWNCPQSPNRSLETYRSSESKAKHKLIPCVEGQARTAALEPREHLGVLVGNRRVCIHSWRHSRSIDRECAGTFKGATALEPLGESRLETGVEFRVGGRTRVVVEETRGFWTSCRKTSRGKPQSRFERALERIDRCHSTKYDTERCVPRVSRELDEKYVKNLK